MTIVKLKLPDQLANELPKKQRPVQRIIKLGMIHYKVEKALKEYKRGRITLARAGEISGLSLREIIPLAYASGLEPKIDESLFTKELSQHTASTL